MEYQTQTDTETKFDRVVALLIVALVATLFAFFTGFFPYPYGWIVISLMLIYRLTAYRRPRDE